ncbi:MAG: MarR family winged helix-turn-helix transcriptional regulator [Wenzhouxiangella sp.]
MTKTPSTESGQLLSDLVLDLFRVSNQLQAEGDRRVADLGLTSARWKVLGTIAAAKRAQPVAWLARDLGANRQNIQRIVNDLRDAGLVDAKPNPHHRRAPLIEMTAAGAAAFAQAMRVSDPWMAELASEISAEDLSAMRRVLDHFTAALGSETDD